MLTRAISWVENPESKFLLEPHDDTSQVFCDRNNGWEIQDVSTLVAINFYPQCEYGQGALRVFDLQSSQELIDRIGVNGVGYPYPQDMVDEISYVDICMKTGDVVIINGSFVHCVMKSSKPRLVLNSFMGDLSSNEIIYWT